MTCFTTRRLERPRRSFKKKRPRLPPSRGHYEHKADALRRFETPPARSTKTGLKLSDFLTFRSRS